jgi:hypothetical protein
VHWTDFLTERDQAVLAATSWAKREPFGLGKRPAVVVVDLYYAALGLPRTDILDAVRDWPSACGQEGWAAVDRTAALLATARSTGAQVTYLHATPPRDGRWFEASHWVSLFDMNQKYADVMSADDAETSLRLR